MNRRQFGLYAVLAILLAVSMVFWQRPAPAPAGTPEVVETASPADGAAGAPNRAPRTPADSASSLPFTPRQVPQPPPSAPAAATSLAGLPPLPDANLPLGEVFETLEQRARAGDVKAASRLAQDAACCASLDGTARMIDRMNQPGARVTGGPQAEMQQRMREVANAQLLALNQYCGSVPSLPPGRVFDYAMRAAELGDPVATMELLGGRRILGGLQTQAVAEYERLGRFRQSAMSLLLRQIERGNLDAVRLLAAAHATPEQHVLGGLLEQDPQTALTYDLLYVRAGGQAYRNGMEAFIARQRSELPPEAVAAAEARADALYRAHFQQVLAQETGFPELNMPGRDPKFQPAPALASQMRKCPRPDVPPGAIVMPR